MAYNNYWNPYEICDEQFELLVQFVAYNWSPNEICGVQQLLKSYEILKKFVEYNKYWNPNEICRAYNRTPNETVGVELEMISRNINLAYNWNPGEL